MLEHLIMRSRISRLPRRATQGLAPRHVSAQDVEVVRDQFEAINERDFERAMASTRTTWCWSVVRRLEPGHLRGEGGGRTLVRGLAPGLRPRLPLRDRRGPRARRRLIFIHADARGNAAGRAASRSTARTPTSTGCRDGKVARVELLRHPRRRPSRRRVRRSESAGKSTRLPRVAPDEDRSPQGDRRGRAPGGAGPRRGQGADREGDRGRGRARRGRGRLPPRLRVQRGGGEARRRRLGRRRRAQGEPADRRGGRAAEAGPGADRLPPAAHQRRARQVARAARA